MKRLLLISNSTLHGSGYLDHCADEITDFLGKDVKKVTFVPFARPSGISHDEYTSKARERFEKMGYQLDSVHEYDDPKQAGENAEAVFIGGGNSFVLLGQLQKYNLLDAIRDKVNKGMPYIGTSAGSNAACPSIMTTNDMPIMEISSFKAIDVFPYQINPHYLDPEHGSTHKGETRETRINEFHAYNDTVVIGLREGCSIRTEGETIKLVGINGARIFQKNKEPYELDVNEKIEI